MPATTAGRAIGLVLSLAALLAGPAAAPGAPASPGPTFDCARAAGKVEKLICKDAGLIALDRKMAAAYAKAMKTWPANIAAGQRVSQRRWIEARNDCGKADDPHACTALSYRTRIVELQIKSAQWKAPKPVGFACAGGADKPFFASFYQQTDPPSAVFTYGDDRVIALVAPSGSGARYTAANFEFWEHQGVAAVNWRGTALTCRPRTAPAP